MVYVDTSALVALLTLEPATPRVAAWFASNTAPLVSADWCAVEFASALAAKLRAKQLRPVHAKAASQAFDTLTAGGLRLLPVSRTAFQQAAKLCAKAADNLRAGDALHVAVALEAGVSTLAGLDAAMNEAAVRAGLGLAI